MNYGRPKYDGPILKPIWHNSNLQVTDTPVIRAGVVYAIGQTWDSQTRTLHALDLKTGRSIWSGRAPAAHIVGVGAHAIFTDDGHGSMHAFDAASGRPVKFRAPESFGHATLAGRVLYVAGRDGSLSALELAGEKLWSRQFAVPAAVAPVVTERTVYVYGVRHVNEMTPDDSAVYAVDRKTGALQWKRELRERFGKYRYDPKAKAMRWRVTPDHVTIGAVLADAGAAYLWEQHRDEHNLLSASDLTAVNARGTTRWQHRSLGICLDPPNLLEPDAVLVCGSRTPEQDGELYDALLRRTGATLWRGATSWNYERYVGDGQFAIVSDRRVQQVIDENNDTSPDSWLTLVDRRSGREVWRTEVVPLADFTLAAVDDGVVVVAASLFVGRTPASRGVMTSPAFGHGRCEPNKKASAFRFMPMNAAYLACERAGYPSATFLPRLNETSGFPCGGGNSRLRADGFGADCALEPRCVGAIGCTSDFQQAGLQKRDVGSARRGWLEGAGRSEPGPRVLHRIGPKSF